MSTGTVTTLIVNESYSTQNRRFQAAMKMLQPIASMLASLPPSRFRNAVQWLEKLDYQCRSGEWESELTEHVNTGVEELDSDSQTAQDDEEEAAVMNEDLSVSPMGEVDDTRLPEAVPVQEHGPDDAQDDEEEAAAMNEDLSVSPMGEVDDTRLPEAVPVQEHGPGADETCSEALLMATSNELNSNEATTPVQSEQGQTTDNIPMATESQSEPAQLTLPQAVRQIGRPPRVRQRIYSKRPIVLEKLSSGVADTWRLKKVVSGAAVMQVLNSGRLCTSDDLLADLPFSLLKEDRFQLRRLEPHFQQSAWAELKRKVDEDNSEWHCSLCDESTQPVGRHCRWVQCDACIVWLHFQCVGIKRKPRGNFFCSSCK